MVLKMKNFNILGVHWTIRLLGGGGELTKNQYRVGIAWKEGLGQFANLGGAWQERVGGVFEGGVDTPMHTMRRKLKPGTRAKPFHSESPESP